MRRLSERPSESAKFPSKISITFPVSPSENRLTILVGASHVLNCCSNAAYIDPSLAGNGRAPYKVQSILHPPLVERANMQNIRPRKRQKSNTKCTHIKYEIANEKYQKLEISNDGKCDQCGKPRST